jgi:octaprenyl-diphosphate synthase
MKTRLRICVNLELIGMAFQIKDDLSDYSEEAIGKTYWIDIRTKNDFAANTCFKYLYQRKKSWLINFMKNHNKEKRVKVILLKTIIV